ncbi:MAG: hypothetical protein JSU68_11905 [Phycisphaerales bacterium]|nr:MAG: hypothetical protein JSU68_11905 [Phycisphaerales bacterium]
MIVISSGQGYVVDPEDRKSIEFLGCTYETVHLQQELNLLVLGTSADFEAVGHRGREWRTRRVSWDGMRNLAVIGCELHGEAWSALDDCWRPFRIELRSGAVEGGAYHEPE